MQIQVGIITISDRASAGDYKDLGGPALKDVAQTAGWQILAEAIVPDDGTRIQEAIRSVCPGARSPERYRQLPPGYATGLN